MALRVRLRFLLIGLALALPGCVHGLIYTHITEPLDLDLDSTPVFDRHSSGQSDTKELRYWVAIQWDSNAIGDAINASNLTRVEYADLETLSVLGFWTQRTVHVYGQ